MTWARPVEYPNLSAASRVAIDLETWDPHLKDRGPGGVRRDGYIVGVSLATESQQWYLPIRHPESDNFDPDVTMEYCMDLMKQSGTKFIGANCLYDMEWLDTEGVNVSRREWLDVQNAAALIDENRMKYSLDSLGLDYMGVGKSEDEIDKYCLEKWGKRVKAKEQLWRMPAHVVAPYAEQDARLAFDLWLKFEPLMRDQDVWTIFEMEAELTHMLLAMRKLGVRVDLEAAEKLSKEIGLREDDQKVALKSLAGQNVDVWAAQSIASAFDKAGIEYPRTEAGSPSFTKVWLDDHDHPLAAAVVEVRRLNRLRSVFVDRVVRAHNYQGRIYTSFHQLRGEGGGAVTGRFSSSNPNLQQIPARDSELAPLVRGLFMPDEGQRWALLDYSQIEPRVLIHYAAELGLRGSSAAVDSYTNNPDTDYHKWVADMTDLERRAAKTINLGLMYGMGRAKLARSLSLSLPESDALSRQYHTAIPFVRELSRKVAAKADERGLITTLLGRKRRFNLWTPELKKGEKFKGWYSTREACREGHPDRRPQRGNVHKAMNSLIQGTAADIMKKAMVLLWREGIVPHLTVHDEVDKSVSLGEEGDQEIAKIKTIMEDCVHLNVPLLVKTGSGPSWGKADHD